MSPQAYKKKADARRKKHPGYACESIKRILDDAAAQLPGLGIVVSSADDVLLEHYAGKFDIMDPTSSPTKADTIQFFASTTKLLTSVAILQLIDTTDLTLDTPASRYLPQLKTPLRIFDGVDETGAAKYRVTNTEITVTEWKATLREGEKGRGFVNSCVIDNLVNTPIVEEPGTLYQYGNNAEWLGLFIQNATGQSLEAYMQKHIFVPLGMKNTTFFPFDGEQATRLMPLRWLNEESGEYEVLTTQFPGLTLPRVTADIEYAVGGGGIYSTAADYSRLLRHLLQNYLVPGSPSALLKPATLVSLFKPSLPLGAQIGLTDMVGEWYNATEVGDLDWSTGMCLYLKDGPRGGFGRRTGSAGWAGAGGTEYFIDPATGITMVFTTNILPHSAEVIKACKLNLEKAVYEALV
ncbi:hypothetical protein RQP46_009635 [Phenoliferia psychrophenolica]